MQIICELGYVSIFEFSFHTHTKDIDTLGFMKIQVLNPNKEDTN